MKTGEALAQVRVSCKELAKETMISGWKTLVNDSNVALDSYIKFTLSYTAVEELSDGLVVSVSVLNLFIMSDTTDFSVQSVLFSDHVSVIQSVFAFIRSDLNQFFNKY